MPDSDFHVDLRDIRFALYVGTPMSQLLELERYSVFDTEQLDLLVDECSRFTKEVISPIDGPGDRIGCRYSAGKVTMPEGFANAYRAICENGWLAVEADEDRGGMGLPYTVAMAVGEMTIGGCCSLSLVGGLTNAAAHLLEAYASEELKALYLQR